VSHDAVALGELGTFVVVTDARRGELYWSAYDGPDAAALPTRTHGPSLVKAAELDSVVPVGHRIITARTVSAGALGMLAEALYANKRAFAADEPLYLRSPDVTLSAGPKRVTG
jgi:tRNA A37 threonylcarbamoyladenosine modification protein TsaB